MVFLELNFVFLFNELSLTIPQGYQAREADKQFAALIYFAVQTELNCFPVLFFSSSDLTTPSCQGLNEPHSTIVLKAPE